MISRFLNLFRRRGLDRELDAELRYHLESLESEHIARGLSPDEARMAAQRDFGGVVRTREAHREQRGLAFLDTLWQDLRYCFRSLRRTPTLTLVAPRGAIPQQNENSVVTADLLEWRNAQTIESIASFSIGEARVTSDQQAWYPRVDRRRTRGAERHHGSKRR